MLERREAAARVAEKLFRAEVSIDLAIAAVAELLGELPTARMAAGVSAMVGQPAFDHAARSLASLSGARAAMIAVHEELSSTHRRIGLGTFAAGPFQEKGDPAPPLTEPNVAKLRVAHTNGPVSRA